MGWESRTITAEILVWVDALDRDALVLGEYEPSEQTAGVLPDIPRSNYSGDVKFSSPRQVIENLNITGSVDFNGYQDCVLSNCLVMNDDPDLGGYVSGKTFYGVRSFSDRAIRNVVKDCTIFPLTPSENHYNGFWGKLPQGKFIRNDVYGWIDGCNVSGEAGEISGNHFHDSPFYDPHGGWSDRISHNDGIQISATIGNWVFRGNRFNWAHGGASCILITNGSIGASGCIIDRNFFYGGACCVNIGEALYQGKPPGGMTITGNRAVARENFRAGTHVLIPELTQQWSTIRDNLLFDGKTPWRIT